MNPKNYNSNTEAFFALVRAGLWETNVQLLQFESIDYSRVLKLAEEQSVVGLVAAGLEHVSDIKVPKVDTLNFVGPVLQLELRNAEMNQFIERLIQELRTKNVNAVLVKGQGIAQCYEKPQWRSSGDVDFMFHERDYENAKAILQPLASIVETEGDYQKHLSLTINSWEVELHGSLRTQLSSRVDRMIDKTQEDVFLGGQVRSWMNGKTQVLLPSPDNDIIFIFSHFLKHFYKGGLGLRQICDWCRLLWTYRDALDVSLLKKRLRKAGLRSEWAAFGAFAVEYLGMPNDAMPLYADGGRWKRKACRIKDFILMSGNFGHNRDRSYFEKYPYIIRKLYSFGRRTGDVLNHARLFPLDSLRFLFGIVFHGIRDTVRGE